MIYRSVVAAASLLGAAACAGSGPRSTAPEPATTSPATTTAATTTAATSGAKTGTTARCPGGNGVHISATSGSVSDSSSGVNTVIGLNQSVDTTLVFDITRKTWTLTDLAASISVGLADEARGRYAICAGVTALMPSATLTISGARGRVHFAASLKQLTDALRLGPVQ